MDSESHTSPMSQVRLLRLHCFFCTYCFVDSNPRFVIIKLRAVKKCKNYKLNDSTNQITFRIQPNWGKTFVQKVCTTDGNSNYKKRLILLTCF